MRVSRKFTAASALLASAGLAIVGCSSNASSASTASSSAASASQASGSSTGEPTASQTAQSALSQYLSPAISLSVGTQLSKRPPATEKIYYLASGDLINQQILAGVKAADSKLGWQTTVLTYNFANPATENSAILSAVNAGANAIIFAASNAASLTQGLQAAKQHGVIVISDAGGNPPGTPGVTANVNSAYTSGVTWGKLVGLGIAADAAKAGKPAHVAEITAPVFANILKPIDDEVKATVAKYCTGCTYDIVNISAPDVFAGKVPSDVVSYLQAHPDVSALSFSAAGDMQIGMSAALKAAGMSSVSIYGVAPEEPQLQELKSGTARGYAIDPLLVTGWMCVDAVARQLVDHNASLYDTAGSPTWYVTPQSSFDAANPPQVPADYQAQFARIWHLS
jgi:ABC-type sugar transport system substrate-binding protein